MAGVRCARSRSRVTGSLGDPEAVCVDAIHDVTASADVEASFLVAGKSIWTIRIDLQRSALMKVDSLLPTADRECHRRAPLPVGVRGGAVLARCPHLEDATEL